MIQLEANLLWDRVIRWLLGLNSLCKSLSCRASTSKQVGSYDCSNSWLNPDILLWNFIPNLKYKLAPLQKEAAFPASPLSLCFSLPFPLQSPLKVRFRKLDIVKYCGFLCLGYSFYPGWFRFHLYSWPGSYKSACAPRKEREVHRQESEFVGKRWICFIFTSAGWWWFQVCVGLLLQACNIWYLKIVVSICNCPSFLSIKLFMVLYYKL